MKDKFDIDYGKLLDDAMFDVVHKAMQIIQKYGIKNHGLYIIFRTNAKGVGISDSLMTRFPTEMLIVLQHQFESLLVENETFSVTLSFSGVKEKIVIPYKSILSFHDRDAGFELKFNHNNVDDLKTIQNVDDSKEDNTQIQILQEKKTNIIQFEHYKKELEYEKKENQNDILEKIQDIITKDIITKDIITKDIITNNISQDHETMHTNNDIQWTLLKKNNKYSKESQYNLNITDKNENHETTKIIDINNSDNNVQYIDDIENNIKNFSHYITKNNHNKNAIDDGSITSADATTSNSNTDKFFIINNNKKGNGNNNLHNKRYKRNYNPIASRMNIFSDYMTELKNNNHDAQKHKLENNKFYINNVNKNITHTLDNEIGKLTLRKRGVKNNNSQNNVTIKKIVYIDDFR